MGVFVIQNVNGCYLNRESEWNPVESSANLFYSPHKDVALNQLLEINSHDVLLRANVVACPADARGRPLIEEINPTDDIFDTKTQDTQVQDSEAQDCEAHNLGTHTEISDVDAA